MAEPTLPGIYKPTTKAQKSFGICIYGASGSGKTSLIGTMPGKGLVIDVPQLEGGTFVLEDHADRIDVYPVETWDEVQTAFHFLKTQKHSYKWVAIDSITALTELAKRKIIGERDVPDLRDTPHKLRIQDWGDLGQLTAGFVQEFQKLSQHKIWIGQETTFGSEERPPVFIGPDTRGKTLEALLPAMTLTGHLHIHHNFDGTVERRLRIGPHELYKTKYRSKPGIDVPSVIVNPNLGEILRYLFGQGERPQEAADGPSFEFVSD